VGKRETSPIAAISVTATPYPERTASMVLYGSTPRFSAADDFLPGERGRFEWMRSGVEAAIAEWGEGRSNRGLRAALCRRPGARRTFGLFERASASPVMAEAMLEANRQIDVTTVLPAIDVPTLVLHHSADPGVPVEAARYTAERIPGARLVEQPGDYHVPWLGDAGALLDEVERFLTGARQSREPGRVLSTVLFTDIVESTKRVSDLGDRRWRELLEAYDAGARHQVETHGGRVVKGLGDGHLATFDGPARAIRCARTLAEDADGTMAERFDPERVIILNRNLGVVVDTVFEHDGAVLKFVGDGALVAFGVHVERDDDARRAALAACDINTNLAALQARVPEEERIRVAIGLHSGTVVCGNVGHRERLDFTIFGDTVNVAARVQGMARAGEILVTEPVVDGLDGPFSIDELEETTVKGRARPVRVFALKRA
jgi:class 3 adenylate cyclase